MSKKLDTKFQCGTFLHTEEKRDKRRAIAMRLEIFTSHLQIIECGMHRGSHKPAQEDLESEVGLRERNFCGHKLKYFQREDEISAFEAARANYFAALSHIIWSFGYFDGADIDGNGHGVNEYWLILEKQCEARSERQCKNEVAWHRKN